MPESKVHFRNCNEALPEFPDGYFDLGVLDPPYGINAPNMSMGSNPTRKKEPGRGGPGESTTVKLRKNKLQRLNGGGGKLKDRILNTSKIEWDYERPTQEYFNQVLRVCKGVIVWGGNYFTDMLPVSRCWINWDKLQPWENFSQIELAWTSFDRPAKQYRISNTGGTNREPKIHPTQKPILLYRKTYIDFAKTGFKILDTHVGSGSSRIAAYEMGYDYTGFENDEDNFNAAERRFALHKSRIDLSRTQQQLF